MTLSRAVSGPASKPVSFPLMGHLLGSLPSGGGSYENPELMVDEIDFTQWVQVGAYGMASVTQNSFTNSGSDYIHLNLDGVVAGQTYVVTIDFSRGNDGGTLLVYLTDEPGINISDSNASINSGVVTVELVADGPTLTFRASVGDTTTTVNSISVKKKVIIPPVDFDAQLQSLIDQLKSNGDLGAMYVPKPVVLGQQAMFQDAAGSVPVSADGDPVGMLLDLSQAGTAQPDLYTGADLLTGSDSRGSFSNEGGTITLVDNGSHGNATYPMNARLDLDLPAGYYRLEFNVVSGNSSVALVGDVSITPSAGIGTKQLLVYIDGTQTARIYGTYGETTVIDGVRVYEVPGNHATQGTSAARPEYPGLYYPGIGQYLETGMPIDSATYGAGFLWCFWIKWDILDSNTGSNGGVYQAPRLYVQMNGGGVMRVAVGDNFSPLVSGIEAGTWTHIAIAFNGSLVSAYKDGVLDTTMGASFTGDTIETFKIGQGFGLDREMNGSIDSQFLLAGLPTDYQDIIDAHIALGITP